ncbi:hypothetical protein A2U01_0050240, partial [Trifolium medium]|nr:hypothetical protein [Trifolium medium]
VVMANPNFPQSTVHARHCSSACIVHAANTVHTVNTFHPRALFITQSLEQFSLVCLIG